MGGAAWDGLDTVEDSSLLGKGRQALSPVWGLWQPLTVAEVQKLLGANLVGLKAKEGNSPLRDWISWQSQEDLDSLGLGLHGGTPNGYLVLDFNVRDGLGWPAGWCRAE